MPKRLRELMIDDDTVILEVPNKGTKRKVFIVPTPPEAPSWKTPEPVSIRFGRRLAELRNGRGVTQMQLAQRSGLDRSFISDMERGVKEPTISTLELIAISFNVSMAELMRGVDTLFVKKT